MPRKLTVTATHAELEEEVFFTRSALEADPDSADLLPHTDRWIASIDAVAAAQRRAREVASKCDALRAVANSRLDTACNRFGLELDLALKDRKSARWKLFFGTHTITSFCKQALRTQVDTVLAWAGASEALFAPHKDETLKWAKAGDAALTQTKSTANVRGEAAIAEEELVDNLTRERDGLHAMLVTRAVERGLPRDWANTFFRVQKRRGGGGTDAAEGTTVTTTPETQPA
ncbi:MAG: hypothetical protein HY904_21780 [Deltaproteobacteria bacterium]|nr:hypothetical protein [Deltaproteobacteria bacterium]